MSEQCLLTAALDVTKDRRLLGVTVPTEDTLTENATTKAIKA